jgi:MoaA/NifB/PqqE/SkfB family radical SAM enzyme
VRKHLETVLRASKPEQRRRVGKYARLWATKSWRRLLVSTWYRHTDIAPSPVNAVIRVTNVCNLRCKQCGQWGDRGAFRVLEHGAVRDELSTEEWKSIVSRLSRFCPHLYIFGGEPFARKDVLELVRVAAQEGATIGINTNGTFLNSRGQDIVESGLDYIIVSLDGPKEVNDKVRIGSRGFTTVIEGVKELVSHKQRVGTAFPQIELIMTLTVENQGYIIETARIAKSLSVDVFAVGFGIFTTAELASISSRQAKEEFGRDPKFFSAFVREMGEMDPELIERQLKQVRKDWGSRFKTYPPVRFKVRDYFRHPERPLVSGQCTTPWKSIQIMPNGDVAFCSDFPDFVVGNLLEADLLALWNGSGSRAWRNRIRTKGIFPAESRCCDHYL